MPSIIAHTRFSIRTDFGLPTDVQPADGWPELSPGRQPVLAAQIAVAVSQPTRDPFFDVIPKRHTSSIRRDGSIRTV